MDRRLRNYYIITFENNSEVFREITSDNNTKESVS